MIARRFFALGGLVLGALPAQASVSVAATAAFHRSFGTGCYDVASESCYLTFADATAAAAGLAGQSLRLVPTSSGYAVSWGGGVYRTPSAGAATLPPSDDGQVALPLPQPMPFGGAAASALWIHSNGVVAAGPGIDGGAWNTPPNDFTPSPSFRNAPDAAFWAWHDWNPAEPGSGRITTEVAVVGAEPVLFVTWRDVESFPATLVNRGTFQFQFGLSSGSVVYVWQSVDADTSSPFGSGHLVGWSPAGPSLDPGPSLVGAAITTRPDVRALALAAGPAPVSTADAGTTVHYSLTGGGAAAGAANPRLCFVVLSFQAALVLDLAALGAPGCAWSLPAMDIVLPMLGPPSGPSAALDIPPGLPLDVVVCAQALEFVPPATWNSFVNTLGVLTSNGIESHVGLH